jgi:hypothetical protein
MFVMPIEIRELRIKVKIEEPINARSLDMDMLQLKHSLLKECKKEIKKQLSNSKER